jgi:aryl-alcohol dehydrogenase-like predicted oxidoreductase
MRYKILGRSGLRVSELSLGTMTFGADWGWGSSFEDSKKVFDAYANAGGNFLDTANLYTNGTSEKYVGEFIASEREHFVLATKYSLKEKHGDPNRAGNHRKNLVQSLDNSLKRLKTDYIDLYWIHAWDFSVQPEEVMRALDDQVRAGKILHIGVSDLTTGQKWNHIVQHELPRPTRQQDLPQAIQPHTKHRPFRRPMVFQLQPLQT